MGEVIGEGGFGVVFKGVWMNSINIAIKEMNISMGDLHRVDKEIIVMATYRHPRIISTFF